MNFKEFEKMMKDCDALSGVRFFSSMDILNRNEKATAKEASSLYT